MAIDSMLYMTDVPAAEYKKGQRIPIPIKAGPKVVRDGYGQPLLKRIQSGQMNGSTGAPLTGHFEIRNANWVDPVMNSASFWVSTTSLDVNSAGTNPGNDCPLQVNSEFSVYFVVDEEKTTTLANTMAVLIDIDYPAVSGVVDPSRAPGTPASTGVPATFPIVAFGESDAAAFTMLSVDNLKAGIRYILQKMSVQIPDGAIGFIALSGAAAMGGLQRIIPAIGWGSGIRSPIEYSEVLTKGPMNIAILALNKASAAASERLIIFDWVKHN